MVFGIHLIINLLVNNILIKEGNYKKENYNNSEKIQDIKYKKDFQEYFNKE